jgi:DNA-3-methyladenine glycosylase I
MAYHDQEWGTPLRDAQGLFELLLLEGFQAGLSWITVLRKRERYREVLYGFDVQRVAQMSDAEIEELMLDPGIIRNRLKLKAARRNAQAWLALEDPVAFLWSFVGGEPKINHFKDRSEVPAITARSQGHEQGPEKSRLHLRRPDHLLRLHAGHGHGHGPHHRLRPLRALANGG